MATVNAVQPTKTVADPNASYESMASLWTKSRAVCNGERFVKEYDGVIDVTSFTNLLIPFSPSMTQQQFNFYKAEAELPGIVSQFAKMLVGGLLRKQPQLDLADAQVPEEASDWIMNSFSQDDGPMSSFLDKALWEEIQTSRAWVYLDHPAVEDVDNLTNEERKELKPYPVLWQADSVINWKVNTSPTGRTQLTQVIVRGFVEDFESNEFHPDLKDTVWVHELVKGKYQVRVFEKEVPESSVPVIGSTKKVDYAANKPVFKLVDTITNILANGEQLTEIPAWPLNGSIEVVEPVLIPIIDREIALYNKLSRRNHLLYGASTYTPVIASDMPDEAFEEIVNGGLGTWIKLRSGDTASVLETPTAALADMEATIASTIAEMAKMGIRMLSPETEQSGIALELRNAAQTAQLGTLNMKVSNTLTDIICFMLNWRYGLDLKPTQIKFSLSSDFNPVPLGADWLRLVTEWYQQGFIPRSVWVEILKQNDIIPPDYDDEKGKKEVNADELLVQRANDQYAAQVMAQQLEQGMEDGEG